MRKAQLIKGDLPEEIFADFAGRPELAVDCEMMGLDPARDRLCVVQIGAEDGPGALVQIDESQDYTNLKKIMEDSGPAKIFHFARMDCFFLKKRLGIAVKNIFCTKIASKLARTYTDRHGLKELVREITGDTLDKANQSSDWGRADLTSDQLYYAEQDIRYLFAIKRRLLEMLEREGRLSLAENSFAYLPTRVELDAMGYDDILAH